MTASPTDAGAGMPGTVSEREIVGLPSDEEIARAICAAQDGPSCVSVEHSERPPCTPENCHPAQTARTILAIIRPAFEAKEREIERLTNNRDMWKGQCERQAETIRQLRRSYDLKCSDHEATEAKLAQAAAIAEGKTEVGVRHNDDGTIDEVVAKGVTAHLEQMDKGSWYLGLYSATGETWQFWLSAKNAQRTAVDIYHEHSPARSASARGETK